MTDDGRRVHSNLIDFKNNLDSKIILGGSTLRGLEQCFNDNFFYHFISGGKIADLINIVAEIPDTSATFILAVGTNDIATNDSPDEIIKKYQNLIDSIFQKQGNLIIANLPFPPKNCRARSNFINKMNILKIKKINTFLAESSKKNNIKILDLSKKGVKSEPNGMDVWIEDAWVESEREKKLHLTFKEKKEVAQTLTKLFNQI